MKTNRWWHNLEKGQALVEYWPTIPVAIMLMILAGGIGRWVSDSLSETTDAVNHAGLSAEVCDAGPEEAQIGDHNVRTSSAVFDGEYTTVTFTVASGTNPAISHWVLALPPEVAANIVDSSEPYSWVNDDPSAPNGNGLTGIKFDTGYEGGGGNGGGGNGGGGNGGGNGNNGRSRVFPRLETALATESTPIYDTREIVLVFTGQYEFASTELAVKAGTEYNISTISAPVSLVTEETSGEDAAENSATGCGG